MTNGTWIVDPKTGAKVAGMRGEVPEAKKPKPATAPKKEG